MSTLPYDCQIGKNPVPGHLGVQLPATLAPPVLVDQLLLIIEGSKNSDERRDTTSTWTESENTDFLLKKTQHRHPSPFASP